MKMLRGVVGVALASLLLCTACTEEEEERMDGGVFDEQTILDARHEKDEQFRSDASSPIPEQLRASFTGLSYFPPDSSYEVDADFTPFTTPDTVRMQTSTAGDIRTALRLGRFTMTVKGSKVALTAYVFVGSDASELFVPFADKTNGFETYDAGRYLDVEKRDDGDYVIDFNAAYNPYCAYNPSFSCPLVPAENNLKVAIRAGEKRWH